MSCKLRRELVGSFSSHLRALNACHGSLEKLLIPFPKHVHVVPMPFYTGYRNEKLKGGWGFFFFVSPSARNSPLYLASVSFDDGGATLISGHLLEIRTKGWRIKSATYTQANSPHDLFVVQQNNYILQNSTPATYSVSLG